VKITPTMPTKPANETAKRPAPEVLVSADADPLVEEARPLEPEPEAVPVASEPEASVLDPLSPEELPVGAATKKRELMQDCWQAA